MSSAKDANQQGSPPSNKVPSKKQGSGNTPPDETVESVPVVRISPQSVTETDLDVIREAPVTLFVQDKQVVTLLTILKDLPALAVGFLFSEGWIRERSDILDLRVERDQGIVRIQLKEVPPLTERFLEKRLIGSSCGKATSFYNVLDAMHCKPVESPFRVSASHILTWMKEMLRQAPLYRRTRSTHNVSLYGIHGKILNEEDIGRHNAVDRILGRCLLDDIPPSETVMLTTGRLSSEMVIKAARLGVPVLASRSATTTLAISLAERLNMTLLASVRGESLTVHTRSHRILLEQDP